MGWFFGKDNYSGGSRTGLRVPGLPGGVIIVVGVMVVVIVVMVVMVTGGDTAKSPLLYGFYSYQAWVGR
jgi:hypothetical protein